MGEDVVPNPAAVQRAKKEDLQKSLQYQVISMHMALPEVIQQQLVVGNNLLHVLGVQAQRCAVSSVCWACATSRMLYSRLM